MTRQTLKQAASGASVAQRRAYGKLRDIIERRGGTMVYERKGFRYGAWVITLGGKVVTIEATGDRTFPRLDRLYIPKTAKPKHWDDYRNDLIAGAERGLLALLQ